MTEYNLSQIVMDNNGVSVSIQHLVYQMGISIFSWWKYLEILLEKMLLQWIFCIPVNLCDFIYNVQVTKKSQK